MLTRREIIGSGIAALLLPKPSRGEPMKSMLGSKGAGSSLSDTQYRDILFGLIEGTLTDVEIPGAEAVGGVGVFYDNRIVKTLSLPDCKTLGSSSLRGMTVCTYFNLPKVEYVGSNAFMGDSACLSLELPSAKVFGNDVIKNSSIREFRLSSTSFSSINSSSFRDSTALMDVYFDGISFSEKPKNFPYGVTRTDVVFHFKDGDYNKDGEKLT